MPLPIVKGLITAATVGLVLVMVIVVKAVGELAIVNP